MMEPEINCTVSVEWLNQQAVTMKKIAYKNATVKIQRNDLREMFLEITQEKQSKTKLKLKDINVFKKFMNEGKASIKFNSEKCNVMFSNCPPGCLIFFLKTLFIKLTKDSDDNKGVTKEDMQKKLREHMLSEKSGKFDEISPVTNAELDRAKKLAISKSTITTPSPPASKKRRLIDGKMTDNPKAAKQLYAPSPLASKQSNLSVPKAKPNELAFAEVLNKDQEDVLQGNITFVAALEALNKASYFSLQRRKECLLHRFCWYWQIFPIAQSNFNTASRWNSRYCVYWSCCLPHWRCYIAFLCWNRSWRTQPETIS